jgi:hypothetical protein
MSELDDALKILELEREGGRQDVFEMAVGDPESDERGSGARANGGKPQLELIPLGIWEAVLPTDGYTFHQQTVLFALSRWQRGERDMWTVMAELTPEDLLEATKVLEYGVKKYAAWNWAKGMKWSIPVGCFLRHLVAICRGEEIDPESGCHHWGHCVANLVMLAHFARHCPDMNDVQVPELSAAWHREHTE